MASLAASIDATSTSISSNSITTTTSILKSKRKRRRRRLKNPLNDEHQEATDQNCSIVFILSELYSCWCRRQRSLLTMTMAASNNTQNSHQSRNNNVDHLDLFFMKRISNQIPKQDEEHVKEEKKKLLSICQCRCNDSDCFIPISSSCCVLVGQKQYKQSNNNCHCNCRTIAASTTMKQLDLIDLKTTTTTKKTMTMKTTRLMKNKSQEENQLNCFKTSLKSSIESLLLSLLFYCCLWNKFFRIFVHSKPSRMFNNKFGLNVDCSTLLNRWVCSSSNYLCPFRLTINKCFKVKFFVFVNCMFLLFGCVFVCECSNLSTSASPTTSNSSLILCDFSSDKLINDSITKMTTTTTTTTSTTASILLPAIESSSTTTTMSTTTSNHISFVNSSIILNHAAYFNLSKESVGFGWNSASSPTGQVSKRNMKQSPTAIVVDRLIDDLDDLIVQDGSEITSSSSSIDDLMVVEDVVSPNEPLALHLTQSDPDTDSETDFVDNRKHARTSSEEEEQEEDEEEEDEQRRDDERRSGYYRSSSNHHYHRGGHHSNDNDNVDYVMHSPRTVQTKYGALQGIVITFVRYNDDNNRKDNRKPSSNYSSTNDASIITLTPVEAFLGVPYASPPSGNLRFMPPVAPQHWRGVRQANHLAPVCPQPLPNVSNVTNQQQQKTSEQHFTQRHIERLKRMMPFLRNQSEDCLHLNIYVPFEQYYQHRRLFQRQRQQQQQLQQRKKQTFDSSAFDNNLHHLSNTKKNSQQNHQQQQQKRYPVIVFISGDSYETGTGNSFDASIWASYGKVIVVTLNYRLGVLGFLPAMVDRTIRGNYGLMDQVAALHWIQENIAEFGGEPGNVTVMGHGFGAACVHLLMLSPMAKGLFSRVSLMSGSALAPSAIAREAENYARLLAKEMNCPVYDNIQLVDCLKRKPFDELVETVAIRVRPSRYLSAFGPIIDGIVVVDEPRSMMESMVYGPLSTSNSNQAKSASSSNSVHYLNGPSNNNKNSASSSSSSSSTAINSDLFSANHYYGDILFGVTRVQCPLDVFTAYEERYGINVERRNQVLRTLIRNLFDFHQQTIFWTLINEYTDWTRPSEHPINLLDSTIDILGDALVLAPLIETIELYAKSMAKFTSNAHNPYRAGSSSSSSSSFDFPYRDSTTSGNNLFFYVFQNGGQQQSFMDSMSDSPTVSQTTTTTLQSIEQRIGSMMNDELDYLFGAPIAEHVVGHSLGHFQTNWTVETLPNNIRLSEMMITYFTNFAKFGNPNHNENGGNNIKNVPETFGNENNEFQQPRATDSSSMATSTMANSIPSASSTSATTLNWPLYTVSQQRFLLIGGSKPRLRDHYQSHRLSYWLNLIPHLLKDHYDHYYYNNHHHSSSSSSTSNHLVNMDDYYEDLMAAAMFATSPDSSTSNGHHQNNNADLYGLRYIRHHLLDNFDDQNSYDGQVRQITFNRIVHHSEQNNQNNQQGQIGGSQNTARKMFNPNWKLRSSSMFRMNADQSSGNNESGDSGPLFFGGGLQKSTSHTAFQDQDNTTTSKRSSGGGANGSDNVNVNNNENNLLSATIVVGCSLLALNLMVFAGVYYNLQRRSANVNAAMTAAAATALDTSLQGVPGDGPPIAQQQIVYCSNNGTATTANTAASITGQNEFLNQHRMIMNYGTTSTSAAQAPTPGHHHVHHVHYADQMVETVVPQEVTDQSSRTSTLQRGSTSSYHHHHLLHTHHHLDDSNGNGSTLVISTASPQTSGSTEADLIINQSPTAGQHQVHHQYFPMHSFGTASSSGMVGVSGCGMTTTTAATVPPESPSDHLVVTPASRSNRTIRFSLSTPGGANTGLVPSTSTTSVSGGACGLISNEDLIGDDPSSSLALQHHQHVVTSGANANTNGSTMKRVKI